MTVTCDITTVLHEKNNDGIARVSYRVLRWEGRGVVLLCGVAPCTSAALVHVYIPRAHKNGRLEEERVTL